MAPVVQVRLALPVTFQECYVVTAFFRREPSTRVSLGTRRFVPQTKEGQGKEQRRKMSVVNIQRGRQKTREREREKKGGDREADREKKDK